MDATKTALLLNINRNTINRWYNIFRQEIYQYQVNQKNQLYGSVYHGKLKRGRGTLKQPVFGIFECNGRVYTEIVPDCKEKTLQVVILGKVQTNTVIYSDGWRGVGIRMLMNYNENFGTLSSDFFNFC